MGAFVTKKVSPIEGATRPPIDRDGRPRKRNSLAVSISDWMKESDVEKLMRNGKLPVQNASKDPRVARAAKTAESIALGNMRTLRDQVINHFSQINKKHGFANEALLHLVCREGYLRMVEFVVDPRHLSTTTKIDYNVENQKRRTPLHVVFTPPHQTYCGVRLGLDQDGVPRSQMPEGVTCDQDWIKPGHVEDRQRIIRILVENGADSNRLDYHNHSPLHYACMLGWKPSVEFLLERGANPDERITITGQNALMAACEFKHTHLVELLIDETDVPLEAKNLEGETALLYAISSGDVACVDVLCQFGANANIASYSQETALYRACRANSADIANILLNYRAARNDIAALNLLRGEAKDIVTERLERDREEKQRQYEAAQESDAAESKLGRRLPKSEIGQWVPYRDKRGRGIFYYNRVSRATQFEVPVDYENDPSYVVRDAIYGLHFYH